jgi:hypothetical protein
MLQEANSDRSAFLMTVSPAMQASASRSVGQECHLAVLRFRFRHFVKIFPILRKN